MSMLQFNGDLFEELDEDNVISKKWIGSVSHWLTVKKVYQRVTPGKAKQRYYMCLCECGNEKLVHGDGIRKKRIKSCGCWKVIIDSQKAKQMGDSNLKHGKSNTRIYRIWSHMIERCHEPKAKDFKNYGGRGIKVVSRWHDFSNFYSDMGGSYSNNLTIERINVDDDYSFNNCKWITMQDQQMNKRNTSYIDYQGEKLRLLDLAKRLNLSVATLRSRLKQGHYGAQLTEPRKYQGSLMLTYKGETKHIDEWAALLGVREGALRNRYYRGWEVNRIIEEPIKKH